MSCSFWVSAVVAQVPPNIAQRIVSTNLCTDQLLLALVDKKRIVSVSKLSIDPEYAYYAKKAEGIPTNQGLAEEIIRLKPDLVLGAEGTHHYTFKLLQQQNYVVKTYPIANSLQDVEALILSVAEAVGESAKAEQIIQKMHQDLQKAERLQQGDKPLAALWFPQNGTVGRDTLKNQMVEMAGFTNLAAQLGVFSFGQLSIEWLLYYQPDYLIVDAYNLQHTSLAERMLHNPLMKNYLEDNKLIEIPQPLWICGGPMFSEGVLFLQQQLHRELLIEH